MGSQLPFAADHLTTLSTHFPNVHLLKHWNCSAA